MNWRTKGLRGIGALFRLPPLEEHARKTFRLDLIRGACGGILETGWQVFALLLAVRVFYAPSELKASIAAAASYGHLLTPVCIFLIARTRIPVAKAASFWFLLTACSLLVAVFSQNLIWFVVSVFFGAVSFAQQMPLLVHIYSENYSARFRGSLLSNSVVLSVTSAGIFSWAGGRLLDWNLASYQLILLMISAAALVASLAVRQMPSAPLPKSKSLNPLANLSYAWKDRVFGMMLGVWMLMGLGNLIVLPLRVEYMANPDYGINATNSQIALSVAVMPYVARILTTHVWGFLFDRLNFVVVRTLLNVCWLTGILVFFFSETIWVLIASGLIFGVAAAGGNIAWNLWVTKLAPPEKVADYMSVHTFSTGIRGVAAPYIGFYLISTFSPGSAALLSSFLIGLSIVLMTPMKSRW